MFFVYSNFMITRDFFSAILREKVKKWEKGKEAYRGAISFKKVAIRSFVS